MEPAQLRSALQALARLAADPQLLVDFFVNYDCDLQVPDDVLLLLISGSRACTSGSLDISAGAISVLLISGSCSSTCAAVV